MLINVRNNHKLLCHVKAFDRHCNMFEFCRCEVTRRVLENVKEFWTEVPKSGKGKKKARVVNKDRYIPKVGGGVADLGVALPERR